MGRVPFSKLLGGLRERFGNPLEPWEAWERLQHADQGKSTATEWESRLRSILAMRGNEAVARDDSLLVTAYRKGLRSELQTRLADRDYSTLAEIAKAGRCRRR
jgi:hypothetical protein